MRFSKESQNIITVLVASFILGLLVTFFSASEKVSIEKESSIFQIDPNAASQLITKEWVKFSSPDVGFRIDMPSSPRHIFNPKTENSLPERGVFISDGENQVEYIVVVAKYPTEEEKGGQFFRSELNELVTGNPKNQLISFDEEKSLFSIKNMEDGSVFEGKIFRKGNIIYTAFVSYPYGKFPEKQYERFIKSFLFL